MEDSEGQTVEEVTRGEQASNGFQNEARGGLQELRNILKLRDVVFSVAAVLDQQRHDVLVLSAGVSGEELHELREHSLPGGLLVCRVVDSRDGWQLVVRRNEIVEGDLSDHLSSCPVVLIREAWMVRFQVCSGHLAGMDECIQVLEVTRIPWNRKGFDGSQEQDLRTKLIEQRLHFGVVHESFEVHEDRDSL